MLVLIIVMATLSLLSDLGLLVSLCTYISTYSRRAEVCVMAFGTISVFLGICLIVVGAGCLISCLLW